ncbi:MAG TPA: hypothetical protein VGE74_32445 [Gemmata sp.]
MTTGAALSRCPERVEVTVRGRVVEALPNQLGGRLTILLLADGETVLCASEGIIGRPGDVVRAFGIYQGTGPGDVRHLLHCNDSACVSE